MSFPVFINNRNRLTTTRNLVEWLVKYSAIIAEVTILDNDSTYEPLLAWYKELPAAVKLIRLGKNLGPYAFWLTHMQVKQDRPFVVTDSDVVPAGCCPADLLPKLNAVLGEFQTRAKVGPGLRLDNLPDVFPAAESTKRLQASYWQKRLSPECFAAPIDTTFAMYRPHSGWVDSLPQSGVRMDFPYVFEHVPWYIWPLDAEERYYREHCEKTWSSIAIDTKEMLANQ